MMLWLARVPRERHAAVLALMPGAAVAPHHYGLGG